MDTARQAADAPARTQFHIRLSDVGTSEWARPFEDGAPESG